MDSLKIFRIVNKLEGISYLLLLFIAMPLKYVWDMPYPTSIAGRIHGILFVLFCAVLLFAIVKKSVTFGESILYFLLSLVPFGSFYTDKLCAKKVEGVSESQG